MGRKIKLIYIKEDNKHTKTLQRLLQGSPLKDFTRKFKICLFPLLFPPIKKLKTYMPVNSWVKKGIMICHRYDS